MLFAHQMTVLQTPHLQEQEITAHSEHRGSIHRRGWWRGGEGRWWVAVCGEQHPVRRGEKEPRD